MIDDHAKTRVRSRRGVTLEVPSMVGDGLATQVPFEAPDPVSDRSMLILQYVLAGLALVAALLLGAVH